LVFGTVGDKDLTNIWSLLPLDAEYFFCAAKIPRALNAEELCDAACQFGRVGSAFPSVSEALSAARGTADSQDLIVVFGSIFVTAEVLKR
jgi:dihydrofolate synthase/folylpolyglutamate synthase